MLLIRLIFLVWVVLIFLLVSVSFCRWLLFRISGRCVRLFMLVIIVSLILCIENFVLVLVYWMLIVEIRLMVLLMY